MPPGRGQRVKAADEDLLKMAAIGPLYSHLPAAADPSFKTKHSSVVLAWGMT